MTRLHTRLAILFLCATLVPLGVTVWITSALLDHSLRLAATQEVDELSRQVERLGRELYRQARESLRQDAAAGSAPTLFHPLDRRTAWPSPVREFWDGGQPERFLLTGTGGNELTLLRRERGGVRVFTRSLGDAALNRVGAQYAQARALVDRARERDLRRGLRATLGVVAAVVWLVSLTLTLVLASRLIRPLRELTDGLARLGAGDVGARVRVARRDEIGHAMEAFNRMAGQLQASRERLVFVTRLSSWQSLGRKMAHELKNSLTPIRLTMEEMLARGGGDPAFLEQAAQIVIDEVAGLERRVRAFSDLAAEPPVHLEPVCLRTVAEERLSLLRRAHPDVACRLEVPSGSPQAWADRDLLRGMLTNLLDNAAQAAGPQGRLLVRLAADPSFAAVEVHDSGPGLSSLARETLFEPTISFKRSGMGLGLSIVRKSALLCGGDVSLIPGELGGAGFRLALPAAETRLARAAS